MIIDYYVIAFIILITVTRYTKQQGHCERDTITVWDDSEYDIT